MSNVVRLPKVVAWAPEPAGLDAAWRDSAVSLSAILVVPGIMLRRDGYLSLLGERIQRMVNASEDPQEATDALVQDLWEAGLCPDLGHVAAEEAGAYLVSTNPGTSQRLKSWGLLPTSEAGPTYEIAEAREVLKGERHDPGDHLRTWAALLSRLP